MTQLLLLFVIGLGVGALSGTLGVGGGFLMVPVLVLIGGLDQHTAQGTSLLAILPISILGAVTVRRRGVADLGRGLSLGAIGVVGSLVAAQVAVRFIPGSQLRIAFAAVLLVVAAQMLRGARWPSFRGAAPGSDSKEPPAG